ncbi:MAG: hypothetical protein KGI60_04595 [Patescibacteria group bacterium]|nr:hypothetical protein [Patescibacteria group bacterium]
MKRAIIAAMLVTFVSAAASADDLTMRTEFGSPQYGTLEVHDSSGMTGKLTVASEAKSFDLVLGSTESASRFLGGFFTKDDGHRRATALHAKYSFAPSVSFGGGRRIFSETSLASGYMDAAYLDLGGHEPQFRFKELLYGYRQYIGFAWSIGRDISFDAKGGGSWSGSTLMDDYGSQDRWDNYSVGVSGSGFVRFSRMLRLRVEAEGKRTRYNPDRYFFVDTWARDYEFRSELTLGVSRRVDIAPLFNYTLFDLERNGRVDLIRPEFGVKLTMKDLIPFVSTAYVKGVYAPWRQQEGSESLVSVGAQVHEWNAELYARSIRQAFSDFELDNRIVGFQLAWKFGESRPDHKLHSMDDYGHAADQWAQFYRDNGLKDMPQLTRVQQAERLGTLRKRNEWSSLNLTWKQAPNGGSGFRYPDQTYNERGGDCDEQACLDGSMDRLNGYTNFTMGWWDLNKSYTGHAIELAQDPWTHEWFWNEYGQQYKIRGVGEGSTRDQVAKISLAQNQRFSALPVDTKSNNINYELIDCSIPGTYNTGAGLIAYGAMPYIYERPNVEYGYELFTQRNFLFGE